MHNIPTVQRLHGGEPIVKPVLEHPWENKVTFNPACALVTRQDGLMDILDRLPISRQKKRMLQTYEALGFVLYRAQGARTVTEDHTRSSIGLAICSPMLEPLARLDEPVMKPENSYEDLGCEDARITKVGNEWVLLYTAYSSGTDRNRIRIALATTTDFVDWKKHGPLKGNLNTIDNKNAMLFEQPHQGKFLLLHRPMEGEDAMSIHWATSGDLFGEWRTCGCLMKPNPNPQFVSTWIGGGAPPLHVGNDRYLVIYHIGNRAADGNREYDLGIAAFDMNDPGIVVKRDEPLLRPTTRAETVGDEQLGVNNVVFICAAYFYRGDLYFPYAGSDSVVLAAKIEKHDVDAYLVDAVGR